MLTNVTKTARNRRKVISPKSVGKEEESSNVVSGKGRVKKRKRVWNFPYVFDRIIFHT